MNAERMRKPARPVRPSRPGAMTTVGVIGSGNIGGTVARLAVEAGYDVVLSNSRGPQTLEDLVEDLGPRARAAAPAEAAAAGDLVLVSIPPRAYTAVPVEPLAGKPVLDTINYNVNRGLEAHPRRVGRSRLARAETRAGRRESAGC